jgi:hypothetical protein
LVEGPFGFAAGPLGLVDGPFGFAAGPLGLFPVPPGFTSGRTGRVELPVDGFIAGDGFLLFAVAADFLSLLLLD